MAKKPLKVKKIGEPVPVIRKSEEIGRPRGVGKTGELSLAAKKPEEVRGLGKQKKRKS